MNSNKITLAAIFTLLILLGGHCTAAQAQDWGAATSAAVAASQRGDYALAEASYKEAIESQQQTLGADNPGVAISLNNLAVFYQDHSKYPQAEQAYLQALSILEKDSSQKASTGLTLNNLAALYHDEGMDAKAEPVYKHALGIWESLGIKQSANETVAVMGLAGIYHSRNENANAEPLYLRALKLWHESGKPESSEAADVLFQLGEIYHARATIRKLNPCMPMRWRSGKTRHKWTARKRLQRKAHSEKFTGPRGNTRKPNPCWNGL
jgi:tetratricopeptide (TPR) repeat protein